MPETIQKGKRTAAIKVDRAPEGEGVRPETMQKGGEESRGERGGEGGRGEKRRGAE